jgi:heterodisulfide reductase subunit D
MEQVRDVLNDIPNVVRDDVSRKIIMYDNPYVVETPRKRDWAKEMEFSIRSRGELLYFTGCTAGMKLPQVAVNSARILKAAGLDFAVMKDEPCCGSVMLRTGRRNEAEANARKVVDRIAKSGAKEIVVSCAGCMRTLKEDYSEMGFQLPKVQHIVELAARLLNDGKLKPKRSGDPMRVTYHDPCHIGRQLGIYESPRAILRAIPGVDLVEMETNRETAMCCGAGGGLRSYDSNTSRRIGIDRVRSAERTGARYIASSCPFCEHNLTAGKEAIESDMTIVDVTELLARSLKKD